MNKELMIVLFLCPQFLAFSFPVSIFISFLYKCHILTQTNYLLTLLFPGIACFFGLCVFSQTLSPLNPEYLYLCLNHIYLPMSTSKPTTSRKSLLIPIDRGNLFPLGLFVTVLSL